MHVFIIFTYFEVDCLSLGILVMTYFYCRAHKLSHLLYLVIVLVLVLPTEVAYVYLNLYLY